MTARAFRLGQGTTDPLSIAGLVDSSLQPGGAISLSFADGVVQVTLDQIGDWTITAGLSLVSERLLPITKTLADLGFFEAAEEAGMVYHIWTSSLREDGQNRAGVVETLLRVVKSFQTAHPPSYIA